MYSKHYSRMYILNVSYITITVFWKRDCKLMGKKLKRMCCGRLIKSFTNYLTSCRSEIQCVESSRSFVYLTRYFFFLFSFLCLLSLVLYMSFDKFLLAVESRDLSQADKSIIWLSSVTSWVMGSRNLNYTKKTIWHLAIWQNWCFWQFHHSKEKINICLSFFGER